MASACARIPYVMEEPYGTMNVTIDSCKKILSRIYDEQLEEILLFLGVAMFEVWRLILSPEAPGS